MFSPGPAVSGRMFADTAPFQVVLKSAKKDDSNLAREIHHHRQFVHPHIARLYEVIVTETLVWLVLEYCPGRTIRVARRDGGVLVLMVYR